MESPVPSQTPPLSATAGPSSQVQSQSSSSSSSSNGRPQPPQKKLPPMSLLFHPKRRPNGMAVNAGAPSKARAVVDGGITKPARPSPKPSPPRQPTPAKADSDEEDGLKLPQSTNFQDFRILSTSLSGWKYDVMKLSARVPVDVNAWARPVRLNRKDVRRQQQYQLAVAQAEGVHAMLGADGKPVFGRDGLQVMVDAEGRIVGPHAPPQQQQQQQKEKEKERRKKKFNKKTRQVFSVPEEVRQLRKEERCPWVLEDGQDREQWVGQLDNIERAETHGILMPAQNEAFKFVPTHRWYKFNKKRSDFKPMSTEEMEAAYKASQKYDPVAWLTRRNGGQKPSASTIATFEGRETLTGSMVHTGGAVDAEGRRIQSVQRDRYADLDADDDADKEALRRRRDREMGQEADYDEIIEEEFDDDDDKVHVDGEEEEAKEIEERMKREWRRANKARESGMDESDESDVETKKTKQQRRMEKLLRTREGVDAYESDEDEKNPYASEQESSDEEELFGPPPPAPSTQPTSQSQDAVDEDKQTSVKQEEGDAGIASPVSPGGSGHSVLAQRATSPKAPKLKTSGSRASSPLANGNTSATGSRAGSPVATNGVAKKRKAGDDGGGSGANGPKTKKRKSELTAQLVIEFVRRATPTTKECISHFSPFLKTNEQKARFTALVKEVAQMNAEKHLILRPAYQEPAGESVAT